MLKITMNPFKNLFKICVTFLVFLLLNSAGDCFGINQVSNNDRASYAKIARQSMPSVVTIIVYDYNGKVKGIGSGFFDNKNGDVLTNSHVWPKNTRAQLKTQSGKKYALGSIIQRNEKADFLKAKSHVRNATPFLKIAKNKPAVGDKIMVAGSPMGLEQTITEGIVSAWRIISGKGKVLQISAPISPGSSGGPVLNMGGEVVGIATFQTIKGQNLNFAVPIDTILKPTKSKTNSLNFHKDEEGVIIIE